MSAPQRAARAARRAVGRLAGPTAASAPQAFPPGAFYSPVVSTAQVLAEPDSTRIWPEAPEDPPGIDLRADAQLSLLERLDPYRLPRTWDGPEPPYEPGNDQFPPQDAAVLYAVLRLLRPRRAVEVGCGWSTTVAGRAIRDGALPTELTCVEPHPRPFLADIPEVATLRQERVELTPSSVFDALGAGDVLFIDSSHVVKTGSDVVHLLLHVLPRLADGVVVHVHDVFLPEDYPKAWVRNGFGWTEQYLLQALLVGNRRLHPLIMNRWLAIRHPAAVVAALGTVDLDGSSAWFVTGERPDQVLREGPQA